MVLVNAVETKKFWTWECWTNACLLQLQYAAFTPLGQTVFTLLKT